MEQNNINVQFITSSQAKFSTFRRLYELVPGRGKPEGYLVKTGRGGGRHTNIKQPSDSLTFHNILDSFFLFCVCKYSHYYCYNC